MAEDLYTAWLKIPPGMRPPDYYALLRLPRYCQDTSRIDVAAEKQLAKLRRYAIHPDSDRRRTCQNMMNRVARARTILVDPKKRQKYDATVAKRNKRPVSATKQAHGFIEKVRLIADKGGLKVTEATSKLALFVLPTENGRTQKVYMAPVRRVAGYTVVDIWSVAATTTSGVSQKLANRLLRENGVHKIGYWGIDKAGDQYRIGCHHSMILDTLDPEELRIVVALIAKKTDKLENEFTKDDEF